jgi:hypothetical protein
MKLKRLTAVVASFVGVLALTGSALADTTLTATVGPVAIQGVPVGICVVQGDLPVPVDECLETPPALTVSLRVVVQVPTSNPTVVPPTITPIPCPAGTQGVALRVNTGSGGATIGGTVTVTVIVNGLPVTQQIPLDEVVATPNQTVTIYACAGLAPGA